MGTANLKVGQAPGASVTELASLDIEAYLAQHEQKELVRFVVVGSVDDGKSTFIGRLLYETNGLYEDQVAQVKKASKQGGEELDFSLFTDGLKAEREQAITIDVAYRYFSTDKRKFIIADTPGHVQYTRNMVTGASTADVAVILIDARLGLLPQGRRHAYIASLLGIPWLAVAVNKMDLVGYDEDTFLRIRDEFEAFAAKLGFEGVRFFPVSARAGDNVVTPSKQMPWHVGGTVFEFLETVQIGRSASTGRWRFPVQYVLRPHLDYRAFAGQVASGSVRVGDEVEVLPSGRRTVVKGIDTFDGPLEVASAPQSVALRLADEVDVSRGEMLVRPGEGPQASTRVEAMLVWLGDQPLDPERPYLLKHTTRTVPAELEKLHWRMDLEKLEPVQVQQLGLNDIARATLRLKRPIFADPYAQSRSTGAFVLIDALSNDTVAAGLVQAADAATEAQRLEREASQVRAVNAAERRERLGHGPAVVYVGRGDDAAARLLAKRLERELFDQAYVTVIVEGSVEAARACAEAGLVCLFLPTGDAAQRERSRAMLRVGTQPLLELSDDGAGEDPVKAVLEALEKRGVMGG